MEKGLNDGGFLVCKFIFRVSSDASHNPMLNFFQRVPGQPPLQTQDAGETDDDGGSDGDTAMEYD
jgi:hypothetical protein